MGFNSDDFIRIREEYSKKYLKAREAADARCYELYEKIPELSAIDRYLSGTASRIMAAVCEEGSAEKIAEIKGISRAEVLAATRENTNCLFNLNR